MATQSSITENNISSKISNSICETLVMYDYNPDTKRGIVVQNDKIWSIVIKEDIFGRLPEINIRISDTGTYFHDTGFKPNTKLYVKLTPSSTGSDTDPLSPYIDCIFTIKSFRYIANPDNSTYIYELNGVYDAPKYLNDICLWPTNSTLSSAIVNTDHKYTTKNLIPIIASKAGLKGISSMDSDTEDNMVWLNSNMTYSQFIKKIVSHAWISQDDAPLYFIRRDGTLVYTSIKSLVNSATKACYMEVSKYNTYFKSDNSSNMYCRTYRDAIIDNMSFLNEEGGTVNKSYVYNPYIINTLDKSVLEPKIIPQRKINSNSYRAYTTEKEKNPLMFPGVSNMSPAAVGNVRYISNDIHFMENHKYYDIAPMHNMNIIRKFFQIFAYITIDNFMQVDADANASQRVVIGDKIMIDFSTIYNNETIQTGEFIVTGITHVINYGTSYTTVLTCTRDSITNIK